MDMIVVGVDYSDEAKAALRFALEEAKLRHAKLRVVHAWEYGYIGISGLEGSLTGPGGDIKELRAAAETGLDSHAERVDPRNEYGGDRTARGGGARPLHPIVCSILPNTSLTERIIIPRLTDTRCC